jgi:hypothetical protein
MGSQMATSHWLFSPHCTQSGEAGWGAKKLGLHPRCSPNCLRFVCRRAGIAGLQRAACSTLAPRLRGPRATVPWHAPSATATMAVARPTALLELVSSTQTTRAEPSFLRRSPSATGRSAPFYRTFSATGMSAPAPSFRGRYSSRRHAPRATAATTAASTIMLFTFMVFSPSSAIASIGYRGGPLRSRTQLLLQRFSTPVDAKMPLELCTSAKPKRATRDRRDDPPMQLGRARP